MYTVINVISLSIPCSSGSGRPMEPFPNDKLASSFLERSLFEKADYSYGYDLFPVVVNQQKLVGFFGCFLFQKVMSRIFHFLFYFSSISLYLYIFFSPFPSRSYGYILWFWAYCYYWISECVSKQVFFLFLTLDTIHYVCFICVIHACQFLFHLKILVPIAMKRNHDRVTNFNRYPFIGDLLIVSEVQFIDITMVNILTLQQQLRATLWYKQRESETVPKLYLAWAF